RIESLSRLQSANEVALFGEGLLKPEKRFVLVTKSSVRGCDAYRVDVYPFRLFLQNFCYPFVGGTISSFAVFQTGSLKHGQQVCVLVKSSGLFRLIQPKVVLALSLINQRKKLVSAGIIWVDFQYFIQLCDGLFVASGAEKGGSHIGHGVQIQRIQLHRSLKVRHGLVNISKGYKVQAIQNMSSRIIGV